MPSANSKVGKEFKRPLKEDFFKNIEEKKSKKTALESKFSCGNAVIVTSFQGETGQEYYIEKSDSHFYGKSMGPHKKTTQCNFKKKGKRFQL